MKELKVQPITNGTVIDHITPGCALKVLKILNIPQSGNDSIVSVVMHVGGKKGTKDIVKIENRELQTDEVDKIALIAPDATINIIRDYEVVEKHQVDIPNKITGIVICSNPNCISNANEPITSRFVVKQHKPFRIRCAYCDRELNDISTGLL